MSTPRVLVWDTSYLCEMYEVPRRSAPPFVKELRARTAAEIKRRSRMYVPVPALYELANHVAQVKDGSTSRDLATKLAKDVRDSLRSQTPWTFLTSGAEDTLLSAAHLLEGMAAFEKHFAAAGVGLTDLAAIHLAKQLAAHYAPKKWPVHIWTKDKALKAHEPDAEPAPLMK